MELLPLLLSEKNPGLASYLILPRAKKKAGAASSPAPATPGTVRGAALYALGRYAEAEKALAEDESPGALAPWQRALAALSPWKAGEARETGLEDFFLGGPFGEAWEWAWNELSGEEKNGLPAQVISLCEGRREVAAYRYPQGLGLFKAVLAEDQHIFLRYPELLADLGKAFQYSPSARAEGEALFARWGESTESEVRYRCLFYAGRINRLMEDSSRAEGYFSRALAIAPDKAQADACLWYLISLALNRSPEETASRIEVFLPRRNRPAYFEDVIESFARKLCAGGHWKTLARVFPVIRDYAGGAGAAQYAWLTGRALEESFLRPEDLREEALREGGAAACFRIALEENSGSFYYRAMSAAKLGESLLLPEEEERPPATPSPWGEFFLGFFDFGAGEFMAPRLQKRMDSLSTEELRLIAGACNREGRYLDSITLTGRYLAREGAALTREDLLLSYPRPFRELIEGQAEALELGPELLSGLIRTESAFTPDIVSRSGAVGLTQLMPATAMEMAGRIARSGGPDYRRGETLDLADPELNIHIGAYYLKYLIERLGSPMLALLSYNGGMNRVRRWRQASSLPLDLFLETIELSETRDYGRQVLGAAAAYGYLYYGMSMEAVAKDIYREH